MEEFYSANNYERLTMFVNKETKDKDCFDVFDKKEIGKILTNI